MNKKTFITICLLGITSPLVRAHYSTSFVKNTATLIQEKEEERKLPLRKKENHGDVEIPPKRSIIPIPEVTLQGNTLHFITPCEGYTFRLVQGDTVCYSEEISGDTLTIPTTLSGTYELQIVNEDYIFYTNIDL